ncbi:MAG: flavodoxin domain-containing protein [Firmicutes bacterium]|nr:flavodoxin domain-containing protein [Bacillota bacterium]
MNIFIIYDSFYGNTLKVTELIKDEFIAKGHKVSYKHVDKVEQDDFIEKDYVIFGSPTRGFRPSPSMSAFLKSKVFCFTNQEVFVFDTRIDYIDIKSRFLKRMMKCFGFAADHMKKTLEKRNATVLQEPKGFFVVSSTGPLKPEVSYQIELWVDEILKLPK